MCNYWNTYLYGKNHKAWSNRAEFERTLKADRPTQIKLTKLVNQDN